MKIGNVLVEFKLSPVENHEYEILTLTEKNGFIRQVDRFKKRLATEDISKYKVVERNTIAFNPYLLWAGALALNDNFDGGIVSPLYPTFRVKEDVDAEYLLAVLLSPQMIQQFDQISYGSVPRKRRSSVKDFLNLQLPELPSLGEQKRIAEILGGVSKAIQKTKVQLLLVDSLGENKYLSLSKDADTFKSLKDLGVKKITGKSIVAKPDNEHGINQIIKVSAVSSGRFIASETKPLPADYEPNNLHEIHQGDLLFARASGSANLLGACCIVDKEIQHLYLPDKVWKLEVDEDILPKVYLLQALRGREFRSVAESHFSSSTGVKNIKTSVLMEFKIPVLKKDQLNDYAHFVKTLDNLRHLLHRKLSLLQELQKSLSNRAFAGLL
jgi:type I restriction enzyme stySJI specificity protein